MARVPLALKDPVSQPSILRPVAYKTEVIVYPQSLAYQGSTDFLSILGVAKKLIRDCRHGRPWPAARRQGEFHARSHTVPFLIYHVSIRTSNKI